MCEGVYKIIETQTGKDFEEVKRNRNNQKLGQMQTKLR